MNKKATGIIRNLDPLGRIVIPKEIRDTFCMNIKDPVEIYVGDNAEIILKKYEPACIFCGKSENIVVHNGKQVCKDCISTMQKTITEE